MYNNIKYSSRSKEQGCSDEHDDDEDKEESQILQRLSELAKRNPDLFLLVEHCRKDINDINLRLGRLMELSKLESTRLLPDLSADIALIKDEVLQNVCDIITLCISAGAGAGGVMYYQLDTDSINDEFDSNQTKIILVDKLLNKLAIFINQHDTEFTNMPIQTWISVLDTLTNGNSGETQEIENVPGEMAQTDESSNELLLESV